MKTTKSKRPARCSRPTFSPCPVKMWAVWGHCGLYVDTAYTRKDMIERHVSALGHDWEYHKKRGDKLIRVMVTPIMANGEAVSPGGGE